MPKNQLNLSVRYKVGKKLKRLRNELKNPLTDEPPAFSAIIERALKDSGMWETKKKKNRR